MDLKNSKIEFLENQILLTDKKAGIKAPVMIFSGNLLKENERFYDVFINYSDNIKGIYYLDSLNNFIIRADDDLTTDDETIRSMYYNFEKEDSLLLTSSLFNFKNNISVTLATDYKKAVAFLLIFIQAS